MCGYHSAGLVLITDLTNDADTCAAVGNGDVLAGELYKTACLMFFVLNDA